MGRRHLRRRGGVARVLPQAGGGPEPVRGRPPRWRARERARPRAHATERAARAPATDHSRAHGFNHPAPTGRAGERARRIGNRRRTAGARAAGHGHRGRAAVAATRRGAGGAAASLIHRVAPLRNRPDTSDPLRHPSRRAASVTGRWTANTVSLSPLTDTRSLTPAWAAGLDSWARRLELVGAALPADIPLLEH